MDYKSTLRIYASIYGVVYFSHNMVLDLFYFFYFVFRLHYVISIQTSDNWQLLTTNSNYNVSWRFDIYFRNITEWLDVITLQLDPLSYGENSLIGTLCPQKKNSQGWFAFIELYVIYVGSWVLCQGTEGY